ncbi:MULTISPECIES: cytochrome P450 [Kitasatospora]|uniref:Putative cytochrome P450 n=1 Tax=Kitasatospora setae (strain ATCC 33774 / DSM 43861 / JCM 3304 / KCC A-0304 / NBRC 14216 / KM-6054) TaxID=452652 RepID=E4N4E2_KITSK|nr:MULTISPECIES: cytochrome P450 [Kitasatospora]BAJ26073.1 putative cytochrome P450 [Kitasatospora setae KM-6054]
MTTDATTGTTTDAAAGTTTGAPAAQPLVPLHCLLRAEAGPPRLAALPTGTPVWVLTRHADVRQALAHPDLGRAALYAPDAPPTVLTPNILDDPSSILNSDGPAHQAIRRTVQRAFTPRAIERWRPWVDGVVRELVGDLVAAGPPVDAVEALTKPLPVRVISRLMELEGLDTDRLGYWSDHALSTTAYSAEEIGAAIREFGEFGYRLVQRRRKDPGDDLVSSLVRAADQTGGMTEEQITSLTIGLVIAGHETTMTSFGNALVYLLDEQHAGAWRRIGEDLSAATAATEQILRTIPLGDRTTAPGQLRRATADLEIGGVTIPAGAIIAADSTAANADPEVYPPGPLDLFAPLGTPSLTFGAGPHHCLGAWLARMELELGLHHLARALPELRLATPADRLEWRTGLLTRSPLRLEVAW